MNRADVAAELDRMAAEPGISGCALVDTDTGMIWQLSSGARASEPVWEAAVDYWRLHKRQESHFADLGALHVAVMYHATGALVLLPCCAEPELLLVAHGKHAGVNWRAWQTMVRDLGKKISAAA
ncbi:MAG: hypothetical protein ABI671_10500 [Burkholderiales bacterium]